MMAAAMVSLGAADPKSPATHVALGGAIAATGVLIAELEAAWAAAPGDERDAEDEWRRWQRDRPILQVAGKARSERLARAWQALAR
jgi:hypothetical protein